jgi:hypothetical protein
VHIDMLRATVDPRYADGMILDEGQIRFHISALEKIQVRSHLRRLSVTAGYLGNLICINGFSDQTVCSISYHLEKAFVEVLLQETLTRWCYLGSRWHRRFDSA